MKIVLIGNAGSGKTTLAHSLAAALDAACLSLDTVAFTQGTERRPSDEARQQLAGFVAAHERWIIEGVHADLARHLLPACELLIYLDVDTERCIAHCRGRAHEPGKFSTREEQDAMLPTLIDWVRGYEEREDDTGRAAHERLFAAFGGTKRRLNDAAGFTLSVAAP